MALAFCVILHYGLEQVDIDEPCVMSTFFLHFMQLAYLTAEETRATLTVTSFCENSVRLSVLAGVFQRL